MPTRIPARLEALLKTRMTEAGAGWDWAGSSADLFNADQTGFSDEFIQRMQPVMDKLKLNVDLAKVSFEFGGSTNFTEGYHITLQGGALEKLSFDDVLGATLHEVGHVVQYQNAPGATWAEKASYVKRLDAVERQEAIHMYGNDEMRYQQDPYLREMGMRELANTHLLGSFSIDSQANRFRDILLASPSGGF